MAATPGAPLTAATCPCLCHLPGYRVTHPEPCCREARGTVLDADVEVPPLTRTYSQLEDVAPPLERRPKVSSFSRVGDAMRKDTPRT